MVELKFRSSHWIVDGEGQPVFGKGRMTILENIERTGSINQAAKSMKMSYKAVWSKIKATEKHLGITIVHTDRREGSHLSTEGKQLLEKFKRLHAECISADDRIFSDIFNR